MFQIVGDGARQRAQFLGQALGLDRFRIRPVYRHDQAHGACGNDEADGHRNHQLDERESCRAADIHGHCVYPETNRVVEGVQA